MAEDFHPAGHLTESGARNPGAQPAFGDPDHGPALVDGASRDSLYVVEVPPARIRQVFRIHPQLFIKLAFDLELPLSGRRGDDMVLCFENGGEVVFEGFVGVAETEPTLHLLPPDGSLLPGDYVAEALDDLGEAPPMTTEDALAFRAAQIESSAAAALEAAFPVQEILEDLEEQGIAPPALAAGPEAGPGGNGEERVASAADLVSQVASALSGFDEAGEPPPEALPAEAEPTFWPLPEVAPAVATPEDEEVEASLPEEPPALLDLMQDDAGDPFAQILAEEPVAQGAEMQPAGGPVPQEVQAPAETQVVQPVPAAAEAHEAPHVADEEVLEPQGPPQQGAVVAPEAGSEPGRALGWSEAPDDGMPEVEVSAPPARWPQPTASQDAAPQPEPATEEDKVFEALADAFELAAEVSLPEQARPPSETSGLVEAAEGPGPVEAVTGQGERMVPAEAPSHAGQPAPRAEETLPLPAAGADPVTPGPSDLQPDWTPAVEASPDAWPQLEDLPAVADAFEEPQAEGPMEAGPLPEPAFADAQAAVSPATLVPEPVADVVPHQAPLEPAPEAGTMAAVPGTAFADPGADPGNEADDFPPMDGQVPESVAADAVETPGVEVEALDQAGYDSQPLMPSAPGAEPEMPPLARDVEPVGEPVGTETPSTEMPEFVALGETEPEAADRPGEDEAGPSAEAPAREAAEGLEPEITPPPAPPSPSPAPSEPSRSPQAEAARMRVSLLRQKTAAADPESEPVPRADPTKVSRDQTPPGRSQTGDQPKPAAEAMTDAAPDRTSETGPETGPATEGSEVRAEPAKPAKPDAPAPGPATGRFLRTAVANVFRAGTLILPSRGEVAPPPAGEAAAAPTKPDVDPDAAEARETGAAAPAGDNAAAAQPVPDAEVRIPEEASEQPAEPQLQESEPEEPQSQEPQSQEPQSQEPHSQEPHSQEPHSGALPEAIAETPLSQGPGDPGDDLNPMDLFADPLAGEIADFDSVAPGAAETFGPAPPADGAPASLQAPAAPTTGVAPPVEVREAVLVALHQMEDSELFDFGAHSPAGAPSGPSAAASGDAAAAGAVGSVSGAPSEMVDLPVEGAVAPVGVIFAEAPGIQAAAGPGEGQVDAPDAEKAAEPQDGGELLDGEERR